MKAYGIQRVTCCVWAVCAICALPIQAQSEEGLTFYTSFQGSASDFGVVTRLDPNVGYRFNRFFEIDAGFPVYFVRPSDNVASGFASNSVNGIGNFYTNFRLSMLNPAVNYVSTVTATAPTGDREKGLSTGKMTWDWNNHFNKPLGPLAPFANLGVANGITDTPFFVRPFLSRGTVGHFEGGANLKFLPVAGLGGSVYAYEPSGEQTVVSRVVHGSPMSSTPGQSQGRGRRRGVFESAPETVGTADIARDRGFSFWLDVIPNPVVFLELGYSRSTTYALDTVYWNVGVNVRSLMRNARRQ